MQMVVPFSKLKVRDKDQRIRQSIGDLSELKESLLNPGQIYDLLVDENWTVRVGTLRYFAFDELCQETGKDLDVKIDKRDGLSEDMWILIEFHENEMRKDFNMVERALGRLKTKEAYERLYPETKKGAFIKTQPRDKKGRVVKKSEKDKMTNTDISRSQKKRRPSFSQYEHKLSRDSIRTIDRDVELAKAIQREEVLKEDIEKIIQRKESVKNVMDKVKRDRGKTLKLNSKDAEKDADQLRNEQLAKLITIEKGINRLKLKYESFKMQMNKKAIKSTILLESNLKDLLEKVREDKEIIILKELEEMVLTCNKCYNRKATACPHYIELIKSLSEKEIKGLKEILPCEGQVYYCKNDIEEDRIILRKPHSTACDNFDNINNTQK